MRRAILSISTALSVCLMLPVNPALAEDGGSAPQVIGIAIVDFDYIDTSGEQQDQTAAHQKRLHDFMRALRRDLAKSGKYRVVPVTCRPDPCSIAGSNPSDLQKASRAAGAKILLIGGIHKMSTLVQWAKVLAVDVDTDRVVFDKLLTFRADTDQAWDRAEAFVSGEILALPSAQRPLGH